MTRQTQGLLPLVSVFKRNKPSVIELCHIPFDDVITMQTWVFRELAHKKQAPCGNQLWEELKALASDSEVGEAEPRPRGVSWLGHGQF